MAIRGRTVVKPSEVPIIRSMRWFAEVNRRVCFHTMLQADAPKLLVKGKQRGASSKRMPIVSVNDLQKSAGLEVEVDLSHRLTDLPVMGRDMAEGNEEDMTRSVFSLKIDKTRKGARVGDVIDKQALGGNLSRDAQTELADYFQRISDERVLYHFAGARGNYWTPDDLIIPPEPAIGSMQFNRLLVNPLYAPTFDRHFYAGNADSIDGGASPITNADVLLPADLYRLNEQLEESSNTIPHIDLSTDDDPYNDSPFWMLSVDQKVWSSFAQHATTKEIQQMRANAIIRQKGCGHPIFKGAQCFMWENIMIRVRSIPVRFLPGATVKVSQDQDDAATVDQTLPANAGFAVSRSLLLGGQALARAYGSVLPGANFEFWSELYDTGDKERQWIKWVDGCAKIRFESKSGRMNDRGVAVIDSAVPL